MTKSPTAIKQSVTILYIDIYDNTYIDSQIRTTFPHSET